MDNTGQLPPINVQERKSSSKTKRAKSKKNQKPTKVVYISNPMKFKATASQFRALVQELTGQDSELPDPTKYFRTEGYDHVPLNQTVPDAPPKPETPDVPPSSTEHSSEDDHFVPQLMMVDGFSTFWTRESSAHDLDVLRSPYTTYEL